MLESYDSKHVESGQSPQGKNITKDASKMIAKQAATAMTVTDQKGSDEKGNDETVSAIETSVATNDEFFQRVTVKTALPPGTQTAENYDVMFPLMRLALESSLHNDNKIEIRPPEGKELPAIKDSNKCSKDELFEHLDDLHVSLWTGMVQATLSLRCAAPSKEHFKMLRPMFKEMGIATCCQDLCSTRIAHAPTVCIKNKRNLDDKDAADATSCLEEHLPPGCPDHQVGPAKNCYGGNSLSMIVMETAPKSVCELVRKVLKHANGDNASMIIQPAAKLANVPESNKDSASSTAAQLMQLRTVARMAHQN